MSKLILTVPVEVRNVVLQSAFEAAAEVNIGDTMYLVKFGLDIEMARGEAMLVGVHPMFWKDNYAVKTALSANQLAEVRRFVGSEIQNDVQNKYVDSVDQNGRMFGESL